MEMLRNAARVIHARITSLERIDRAATAVEYGIMVAAIAAVIIGVVFAIGTETETAFDDVNTQLAGS